MVLVSILRRLGCQSLGKLRQPVQTAQVDAGRKPGFVAIPGGYLGEGPHIQLEMKVFGT